MSNTINTNELILQRRKKLSSLSQQGSAFPNHLKPNRLVEEIFSTYDLQTTDELKAQDVKVQIAGRIMTKRHMGKAHFAHVQDMSGRIQIYIRQDSLTEEEYHAFTDYDLGDIVWLAGKVFKTHTGELSIKVQQIQLLTKSLRPLPDKFHGLHDKESCYRQRYLDLLVNNATRQKFLLRTQLITALRSFLLLHKFVEVETPMMQVLAGGANAKPFVTYHNTLDMPLYLRVAPELYLKRLVIGGFDRVFELNRNFRNEGLSTRHNPEFTMLELYQAYATYLDLMDFTMKLLNNLAQEVLHTDQIKYQGHVINLSPPFAKLTVTEAVLQYCPDLSRDQLASWNDTQKIALDLGMVITDTTSLGQMIYHIFEKRVEHLLIQPTFITELPIEVSPLARSNEHNPHLADRFELFICGYEIANGFSELNDPDEQAKRFQQQMQEKNSGNDEAMSYDEDYITSLEYGLPPTAGEGIGIDRLVMLFTDSASIRDVILFPHLRSAK